MQKRKKTKNKCVMILKTKSQFQSQFAPNHACKINQALVEGTLWTNQCRSDLELTSVCVCLCMHVGDRERESEGD